MMMPELAMHKDDYVMLQMQPLTEVAQIKYLPMRQFEVCIFPRDLGYHLVAGLFVYLYSQHNHESRLILTSGHLGNYTTLTDATERGFGGSVKMGISSGLG
jgi:hypothetical protein